MDRAILLAKLNNCEHLDSELYNAYINATKNTYSDEVEAFNQYINDLKNLTSAQYDFDLLTIEAKLFNITRRDYRELCDAVCMIIGDKINELCKYSKNGIVTKPTQFEDYCPFVSEALVVYGKVDPMIKYDGDIYKIIQTKIEETPYYTIHCSEIEKQ